MIDRDFFFSAVRDVPFGGSMSQGQVDGQNAILDAWDKWLPSSDLRWIAYSLSTVLWETGRTMQPVRETGEGAGEAYGRPMGPYNLKYYGRGLVQLTWYQNYLNVGNKLIAMSVTEKVLAMEPDLALEPDIASAILVFGMSSGWFTGKKLPDYFGKTTDWVNARRIINGVDHADEIAGFAKQFYAALTPDDTKAAA